MKKPLSIYIHIPFCKSKCHYCNFVSVVAGQEKIDQYIEMLKREIVLRANEFSPSHEIVSVYIGGGTPSSLSENKIQDVLHTIYTSFNVTNNAEITIEINPATVDKNKVDEYLRCGINRFSIGLQSASPHLLRLMGRTHSFEDFKNTVNILRSAGAENISADVMIGLPNQTLADIESTVDKLTGLGIEHISAYLLSIEEGTNFHRLVNAGELILPTENTTINLYNKVFNMLEKAGYERYEFSNFAKLGYESKHNKIYWGRKEYLGLGVASHSYVDGIRFSNTSSIPIYIENLANDTIALESKDVLTKEEKQEEAIMLSLRLKEGIDLDEFEKEFGESLVDTHKDTIKFLIEERLLQLDEMNHLKATSKGFLVLNKIIELLI